VGERLGRKDVELIVLAGRWPSYVHGNATESGGSYRTYLVEDGQDTPLTSAATVALFERSLEQTVRRIVASGKRVVLVGTVPEPGFDIPVITALSLKNSVESPVSIARSDVARRNQTVDRILSRIADDNPRVSVVRVWDAFCDASRCLVQQDGKPFYMDASHLAYGFAKTKMAKVLSERWPLE